MFVLKIFFGLFTALFEKLQRKVTGKQREGERGRDTANGHGSDSNPGSPQPCGTWSPAHPSENRCLVLDLFHITEMSD